MAIAQAVYADTLTPGFPGMVANAETSNRISRTNEDATALPFGRAVFRGAGDHGCTATPSAALLGISIAHEALGASLAGNIDAYGQYGTVPIMTLGVIWVTAGAAVTAGAQAYVTSTGAFTSVSTGNTILTGWTFDTTAASGALVKLAKR